MKFNVPSKSLYSFVSAVNKVINSKNAMTILNNFLFYLEGDKLQVVACDMENTLVARIDVMDAEGGGKFCIDAARIIELLKELPDQGIQFVINDENLAVEIIYSSGTFNLMAINGSEYPYDPEAATVNDSEVASFELPASNILRGIDNTIFAASHDDLRPQLAGVFWDIHPEDITFVASDTKQLVKFVDRALKTGYETSFILPSKPCNVLKNVFTRDGNVKVNLYEKCIVFESSEFCFTCSLLKGRFPDYNRAIPQNPSYTVLVDREEFIRALRRVSVFSGGQGLVKFKISQSSIKMRTDDSGTCGNAYEEVACEFDGDSLLIGFSFKFLIDMFNILHGDEGIIKLTDPSRPGLILPVENDEDTELIMLLMPMTVNEFQD